MELLQGVQYFYTSNGQQIGPVDGTQLIGLAQQGQVTAADHIWAEGFAEWVPVTSVDQLAPLFQAQQQPAAPAGIPAGPANRKLAVQKTAGPAHTVKRKLDVKPKHRFREGASFGKLVTLFVLGIVLLGFAAWGSDQREGFSTAEPQAQSSPLTSNLVLFLSFIGGAVCLLVYWLLSLIYMSRAWSYIQELPVARTTPGKAVGYLFIPFFNIYWLFIAYGSWATDYNKYLDMAEAYEAPRGSPGLAITTCVLSLFGFPWLHPFMMYDFCRGINYLATAPKPEAAM